MTKVSGPSSLLNAAPQLLWPHSPSHLPTPSPLGLLRPPTQSLCPGCSSALRTWPLYGLLHLGLAHHSPTQSIPIPVPIPEGSGHQPPSSHHPHQLPGQHTPPGIIHSFVSIIPSPEIWVLREPRCPRAIQTLDCQVGQWVAQRGQPGGWTCWAQVTGPLGA